METDDLPDDGNYTAEWEAYWSGMTEAEKRKELRMIYEYGIGPAGVPTLDETR